MNRFQVILIGNYHSAGRSMHLFAEFLERELKARNIPVSLLRPAVYLGRFAGAGPAVQRWLGYIDQYVIFPAVLRWKAWRLTRGQDATTVFHVCDQANSVFVSHLRSYPCLLTCHDCIAIDSSFGTFPCHSLGSLGTLLQRWNLRHLSAATAVVCVSEETQRALSRLSKKNSNELPVIEQGTFSTFAPQAPEIAKQTIKQSLPELSGRFVLHVGGSVWYKNRPGVLAIFRELQRKAPQLKLVIVGQAEEADIHYLHEHQLQQSVIFCVGATKELLEALYSVAEFLLFPSIVEGFGVPVAEAISCRCPVVITEISPLKDIVGPAAVYLPPFGYDRLEPKSEWVEESVTRIVDYFSRAPSEQSAVLDHAQRLSEFYTPSRLIKDYIQAYRALL